MKFFRTDKFEAKHKPNKDRGKGSKSGKWGTSGERVATRWDRRVNAVRVALLGYKWGPNGEYGLADSFIELTDPRKKKTHLPHPLFLPFTRLLPKRPLVDLSALDRLEGAGDWEVADMQPPDRGYLSETEKEWVVYSFKSYYNSVSVNISDISVVHPVGVLKRSEKHRTLFIRQGDDAAIIYDEEKDTKLSYCTLEKVCIIVIDKVGYLWLFPHWYWPQKGHFLDSILFCFPKPPSRSLSICSNIISFCNLSISISLPPPTPPTVTTTRSSSA